MFGYIRPVREELRLRDYDRYHAAYCGVCRALGKRFGFFSRFLVNYDMTFLYLLLASTEAPAAQTRCRCPAKLWCRRKPCLDDPNLLETVAAADVILCRYKLEDDIQDSGFLRGLPYRAARLAIRRGYRKAQQMLPRLDGCVRQQTAALRTLEEARSPSIDRTADTFAAMLSECAACFDDPAIRRPMELLLYHVGRYIYLVDALDDLKDDCRSGSYNPLRFRFRTENGGLNADDAAYLREILNGSVNLAGAALELLPLRSGRDILENIIYLGLPAVLRAVERGEFRQQVKV